MFFIQSRKIHFLFNVDPYFKISAVTTSTHLYFEWMIFEIMQSVYIYIPDRLHNIAFLEHIKSALQNVLIKIRFRGIKKDHSISIYLENERSFTFLLFCWMMKILLCLWCVSEAAVQYHRHVYPIKNCLFVHFSVTLVKPEKPLKCLKSRIFTYRSDVVQLLSRHGTIHPDWCQFSGTYPD